MSDLSWIILGVILTSPFLMIILIALIATIGEIFEKFLDLFGKEQKK